MMSKQIKSNVFSSSQPEKRELAVEEMPGWLADQAFAGIASFIHCRKKEKKRMTHIEKLVGSMFLKNHKKDRIIQTTFHRLRQICRHLLAYLCVCEFKPKNDSMIGHYQLLNVVKVTNV